MLFNQARSTTWTLARPSSNCGNPVAGPGKPENLKPFKKGADERRNLKGAPRKLPGLDVLLADVLGYDDGKPEESAKLRKMIQKLYDKALKGNTRAANILLDRAYGKPKQLVDVTGKVKLSFKDAE